ncbi:cyclic-phosphate processing receiver domain-containing protein [Nocardia aurea]|uniref:cyclic-phosphate processing receiver domain-containing protein n=1 Tax=Nocardia aurea TaxID=2144174 RepID=UPI0033A2A548
MKLYVDDERSAPDGWTRVMTSAAALELLANAREAGQSVDALSLDHDLGGDDTTRPIVMWMCEHEWWPTRVSVHSMNPIGRQYLEEMVRRYAPANTLAPLPYGGSPE